MWLFGPPNIERLKARRNVGRLIKTLGDRYEVELRAKAARALGELEEYQAVDPLIALLQERRSVLREAAAQALGRIGDPRAIEPLVALLTSRTSQSSRLTAAQALGQLGASKRAAVGIQIASALIRALKDRDSNVRQSALRALGEIGAPAAGPLTAALQDRHSSPAAIRSLAKIGAPAVEPLLACIKDEQASVRGAAAALLGEIGTQVEDNTLYERIGEALVSLLLDEGQTVQAAAAQGLARLQWEPKEEQARIAYYIHTAQWDRCVQMGIPAVVPLAEILRGQAQSARLDAIDALGDLIAHLREPAARERAVAPLVEALADEATQVRRAAAEALDRVSWQPEGAEEQAAYCATRGEWDRCVEIGAPATRFLALALGAGEASVRRGAATSLGQIAARTRDGGVARLLFPLLDDEDRQVRQTATSALVAATLLPKGDAVVQLLVERIQDESRDIRERAVEPLRQIGYRAVPLLLSALDQPPSEAREAMVETLGEIGDPRAVDTLTPLLEDPERDVRQAAAAALGKIGDSRAVAALWNRIDLDRDTDVRKTVIAALGQIGDASAIESLVAALDTRERKAAAAALRRAAGAEIEPLIDYVIAIRLDLGPFHYDRDAIRALGTLKDRRAIGLLSRLLRDDYEGGPAAEALVRLGGERAVAVLIEVLGSGGVPSRKTAAHALGRARDPRAAAPLLDALDHEDRGVRRSAAEALVHLYHHAELTDETKEAILAQRERITAHHTAPLPDRPS